MREGELFQRHNLNRVLHRPAGTHQGKDYRSKGVFRISVCKDKIHVPSYQVYFIIQIVVNSFCSLLFMVV